MSEPKPFNTTSNPMWYSRTGTVPAGWDLWPYPHQGSVAYIMDATNWLGGEYSQGTNVFFNNLKITFADLVKHLDSPPSSFGWVTLPDINKSYTMENGTIPPDPLVQGYCGQGMFYSKQKNIGTATKNINENGSPVLYTYDVILMICLSAIENSTLQNFYYGYFPANFSPYMPLDANAELWGEYAIVCIAIEQTHTQNIEAFVSFLPEGAKYKFGFPVPNAYPYYAGSDPLPYTGGTVQLNLLKE